MSDRIEIIEQKITYGEEKYLIESIALPEEHPLYGKSVGFIREMLSDLIDPNFPVFSAGMHNGIETPLLGKFLININSKDVGKTMPGVDSSTVFVKTREFGQVLNNILHTRAKDIRAKIRETMKNNLTIAQAFEKIRASGVTNMMRRTEVQSYADRIGAYELVCAIEDAGKRGYMNLMTSSFDLIAKLEEEDEFDAALEEYGVREIPDVEKELEW